MVSITRDLHVGSVDSNKSNILILNTKIKNYENLTKLEHTHRYTYAHTPYTHTFPISHNPPTAFQARGIKKITNHR